MALSRNHTCADTADHCPFASNNYIWLEFGHSELLPAIDSPARQSDRVLMQPTLLLIDFDLY
jgi:hypothetical protein